MVVDEASTRIPAGLHGYWLDGSQGPGRAYLGVRRLDYPVPVVVRHRVLPTSTFSPSLAEAGPCKGNTSESAGVSGDPFSIRLFRRRASALVCWSVKVRGFSASNRG